MSQDLDASFLYFILNGFELNQDYYCCPEDTGLWPASVRRPFWGAYFFWCGCVMLIIYTICFIAIATSDLMNTAAYKMMIVLGVFDLLSIILFGITVGTLSFFGLTFCDCPCFSYIVGSIGVGSWMGSCISSLILAAIRIGDVSDSKTIRKIFEGWRIYIFVVFSVMYGGLSGLLTKPFLFSPENMSFLFNPGIGKDQNLYENLPHTLNNCFVVVGTFILYVYLGYMCWKKKKQGGTNQLSKYKLNLVLQAFFFCVFHLICAILYVYMQYVSAPKVLMIIGHLAWQFGTVSICMVYLTLNRSIRKRVSEMIYPKNLMQINSIQNAVSTSDPRASVQMT